MLLVSGSDRGEVEIEGSRVREQRAAERPELWMSVHSNQSTTAPPSCSE